MRFIQILAVLITILQTHAAIIIDPMNSSYINTSIASIQYNSRLSANLTYFALTAFSVSSIIVDLRHFSQIPTDSNGINIINLSLSSINGQTGQESIISLNNLNASTNKYDFQTTSACTLAVYFQITTGYDTYRYLLLQTTSFSISYSNNRNPSDDSSFVFLVQSSDSINLANNKPVLSDAIYYSYQNSYLDNISSSDVSTTDSTTYWSSMQSYSVPYIPYVTNCTEYGDMLFISQIFQDINQCNLVPISQTMPINQFNFGSYATADTCDVKRTCYHSGQVQNTQYPAWQTLISGLTLFSISSEQVGSDSYALDMSLPPQNLVSCKISSSGDNSTGQFPLRVKLSFGYYQFSKTHKRMIDCSIQYSLYVASSSDFQYQMEIVSAPLNHTDILLSFGFNWYVYMIVFLIIGIVSNIQHFVLFVYHYFTAESRKSFNLWIYLRVFFQVIKGTFGAIFLYLATVFLVTIIMNAKMFSTYLYDDTSGFSSTPRVFWDYISQEPVQNYDSSEMVSLRAGRMGLTFIVIGCYIIMTTSHFFIGREKQNQVYKDYEVLGRIFKPLEWNRGKFLFGTLFYIFLQFFLIYFAYSSLFSANIWVFIVMTKVLQIVLQEITKSVYEDVLPSLPFRILTDITAYLNTLSANNFYDFLFSFLVDVAMTMIEKAYVAQLQNRVSQKIKQKSDEFNKFYLNLMNDDDQDAEQLSIKLQQIQKSQDNQRVFIYRQAHEVEFLQEEVVQLYNYTNQQKLVQQCRASQTQKIWKHKYFQSLQKQFNSSMKKTNSKQKQKQNNFNSNQVEDQKKQEQKKEKQQRQSKIFENIIDNIALLFTFFVQPYVILIFWLTFDQSAILSQYGITFNTVILYLLSAIVIGIFSVLNIILIFHMLENYLNYQFKEQILSLLLRFQKRKTYWKADDDDINKEIQELMRGADHYCLSSQFFFILTIYIGAMIFVMLGVLIIFNQNYNFLDDIATIPITVFWVVITIICVFVGNKLFQKMNIWDYNTYQNQQEESALKKKGKNMLAIYDEYYLGKQESQLKTQNKMMSDQLTSFNLISNSNMQSNKVLSQQKLLSNNSIKSIKKKNYLIENLKIERFQQKDNIKLAQKQLQTVCQKLKPLFSKQAFRIQYSKKNRIYIKQNIEKILPLVEFLPELQDFKDLDNHKKLEQKSKKYQNKIGDPLIGEMLLRWLKVTQVCRQKRIMNGLQIESKPKKCSFCYSGNWGLYYGYGGICLQCSKKVTQLKKKKQKSKKLIQHQRELEYISQDRIIQELDEEQQDQQSQSSYKNFSLRKKKN